MINKQESKTSSSQFFRSDGGKSKSNIIDILSISLPNGGGALNCIDEKFSVNAVNSTVSFSILLHLSPAKGALPALSLSYNSDTGNGILGLGWSLNLPSINKKPIKRIPSI